MVLTYFIDIQTSKELIQMDINKKMRNGIFAMNGEHTHSQKTNITDARQSRKSIGIIDKSECFSYKFYYFQ